MTVEWPRRGGSWRVAAIGLVAMVFAGFSGVASAATVGQTGNTGDTACQPGYLQGEPADAVPAGGGTITSFSFLSTPTNAGEQIEFLVLRPAGGTSYTVVGKAAATLAGTGLETFPASIPTQAGDILGSYAQSFVANCVYDGGTILSVFAVPDPAVGDTVNLSAGAFPFHLNESANLVQTGVSVACSPASVRAGQPVTCTATVTGSSHPSGTVTFASNSSGSFSPASCTLVLIGGNQARCSVTYTPATVGTGTHTVYANYSGDALNPPSHASTTISVVAGPSTTALGCAPSTVGVGQATTCTVTVTGQSHPTGTVSFASNGSGSFSAPSCTLVLIGGNQARCSVTYTPTGLPPTTQTIYANYSGDANNSPSHTTTTITIHL